MRVCGQVRPVLREPEDTHGLALPPSGNGAVLLTDEGRRAFLSAWQKRRQEFITHPFLGEKVQWGLVPYVQALLLARTLRGDLERYPPFFWK